MHRPLRRLSPGCSRRRPSGGAWRRRPRTGSLRTTTSAPPRVPWPQPFGPCDERRALRYPAPRPHRLERAAAPARPYRHEAEPCRRGRSAPLAPAAAGRWLAADFQSAAARAAHRRALAALRSRHGRFGFARDELRRVGRSYDRRAAPESRRGLHRRRAQGIGLPAARRGIATRDHDATRPVGRRRRPVRPAGRSRLPQGRPPRRAGAGDRLGHDRPAAAQAGLALRPLLYGAHRRQRRRRSPRRAPEWCAVSARVFFYVQHLLGIGHLRRAATLARALAEGGFDVLLVSGGAPVSGQALGAARFHQLPPLRAADETLKDLARLDGTPLDEAFRAGRVTALLDLLRVEAPDILITEQFPFGRTRLRFELLPLLEAAKAMNPRPRIVASVRDVVRRSALPQRVSESVEIFENFFDSVLIHADPRLVEFARSFAGWDRIKSRGLYTGFVAEHDLAQRSHVPKGSAT